MQRETRYRLRQWYYYLNKEVREDAIENLGYRCLGEYTRSVSSAVDLGFTWSKTKNSFLWESVHNETSKSRGKHGKGLYKKYNEDIYEEEIL